MEKEIRMTYGEVKAKLMDVIEEMPAEECKELLREMLASILVKHGIGNVEVKGASHKTYEARVLSFLTTLGMPTHILGHAYTKAAIVYLNEYKQKHGVICPITRELYPHVAEMFGSTASRVERAIRHALDLTWNRGDLDVLKGIFGYTVDIAKGRPTNSEFLSMVVEYLDINGN